MTLAELITVPWEPSDYAAWYGAIVATFALCVGLGGLLLNYATVRRDRTRIKVDALGDMMAPEFNEQYESYGPFIMVTARNVGRRPVVIETAWFTFKSKKKNTGKLIEGEWNPCKELGENEKATVLVMQNDTRLDVDDISCAVVRDESGREWKCKLKRYKSKN